MWPLSGETRSFPAPGTPGAFGTVRKHDIHTGVDLYCPDGTSVFAIESGVVVALLPFTGEKADSPWWRDTDAVLIQSDRHVLCYGEINPSLDLKVGDTVAEGDLIGWVARVLKNDKGRPTTMLHLERYTKGTLEPVWWRLNEPQPENLRDPTRLLLKQLMSPVQAQVPKPPRPSIPDCTCAVRLWSGICLPECPRGLATGRRYASWDDVPNDVLLPDRYEARNGHPPPKCDTHDSYLYENDKGECRICDLDRRFPKPSAA